MSTLSHRHGWITRKGDELSCTCTPRNPRHQVGWDCITPHQLAAWRQQHPECKGPDSKARALMWLYQEFGR